MVRVQTNILARAVQALTLLHLCAAARIHPAASRATQVSVVLDGVTYVNQGLVGFGLIPSDFKESTGDTLGGIGSSIALKPGSWSQAADGTYTGTLVVQPDRGFNVETTIDYQSRRHELSFVLSPYTDSAKLSFTDAQKTFQLTYNNTTLEVERDNVKTSGLDPGAVRAAGLDPELPIASTQEPHLSVDAEGLVANADGSYWTSDEYGPYIYLFSATGVLLHTIAPPTAILPMDDDGNVNFSAEDDPETGRGANQGFEGLTFDPCSKTLYAMLQSATIQDGAGQFTRLLAWDVSQISAATPAGSGAPLIGEWVVPLPISDKGKVRSSSEIHFVSPDVFLTLSRDGNGRGGGEGEEEIKYKHADLFSIRGATDIHGTDFDDPDTPVAPKGKLSKKVVPATYVEFVDYVDPVQLARFGLHNDVPDDETLLDAKWESLALAPVGSSAPNDFFLITASDNDFISTHGVSLGMPFDAGMDVDNQFLVFRVTLPGAAPAVNAILGL
ncbi:esterase-like activity of phytase-domain-containing protein [Mycena rebaudengoi]|nr:esterase-like activity of phytase-domain-containing protein [Mycena rebaudengoi]